MVHYHGNTATLAEEQLSAIVASAMDAIIATDENQRIVLFNPAAEKMFERTASETLGRPLDILIPPRYQQVHHEDMNRFSRTGETHRRMESPGQLVGMRASGEEFPIEATISHVTVNGRQLLTAIVRDISERVQMETAMVRAEKLAAAGRVAATMAHEINNPLESLSNALYLISGDEQLSPETREYVDLARSELQRVSHITRQTLQLHQVADRTEVVKVSALVEETRDVFRRKLHDANISFVLQTDPDAVVTGHAGELRQVLVNLMSNAMDAVESGGVVKVRVRRATDLRSGQRGVTLVIADNGRGIPAAARKRIFEPFFTTKGERGTGLGLWVTSGIVTKHRGKIRVRSTTAGPRHGTCFVVFLPREMSSPSSRRRRYEEPAA